MIRSYFCHILDHKHIIMPQIIGAAVENLKESSVLDWRCEVSRDMSTVVIDVSELRSFDSDSVKDLTDFLEKRLDSTVVLAKKEVTLDFEEGKEASRSCLRLLLRKFLHREALKEDFRVITGGENLFVMKERKEYSE